MQDNSDQKELWTGPSGRSWIAEESRQDALLASVADRVIELSQVRPGMRVLDIGCGTGALSLRAATRVGNTGRVLASDISAPLLERATARLESYPWVGTLLGDAAVIGWPEQGFDVAISRFGVMFFTDPPAAFANIARALRPDGQIVFSAWGPAQDNPFWEIPARVATSRLGSVPGTKPDLPGPMGLSTASLAADRLAAAGLIDIGVREETCPLLYPGTVTDLADLCVTIGPARRIINAQGAGDEDVEAIRDAIADAFGNIVTETDGVALPARINFLMAKTPTS